MAVAPCGVSGRRGLGRGRAGPPRAAGPPGGSASAGGALRRRVRCGAKGFGKPAGAGAGAGGGGGAEAEEPPTASPDFFAGGGAGQSKGYKQYVNAMPAGEKKAMVDADGFINVGNLADFPAGRTNKAVRLANGVDLMLFLHGGEAYCAEAYSTAYKFPLSDAKVTAGAAGPVITVPLDGTSYDLATGEVLEWCPTDNPLRAVLGALKKAEDPKPLQVFRTKVTEEGDIFVDA